MEDKIKVVFVDIDGVLNDYKTNEYTPDGYVGIDSDKVEMLSILCKELDLKIVMSSSWRKEIVNKTIDGLYALSKFSEYNLDIYGSTSFDGSISDAKRATQIKAWLDEHPEVEDYIILDDEQFNISSKEYKDLMNRFIYTNQSHRYGMVYARGIFESRALYAAKPTELLTKALEIIDRVSEEKGYITKEEE